jgi:hypothetical protein
VYDDNIHVFVRACVRDFIVSTFGSVSTRGVEASTCSTACCFAGCSSKEVRPQMFTRRWLLVSVGSTKSCYDPWR